MTWRSSGARELKKETHQYVRIRWHKQTYEDVCKCIRAEVRIHVLCIKLHDFGAEQITLEIHHDITDFSIYFIISLPRCRFLPLWPRYRGFFYVRLIVMRSCCLQNFSINVSSRFSGCICSLIKHLCMLLLKLSVLCGHSGG
jgi:hypothetical protein